MTQPQIAVKLLRTVQAALLLSILLDAFLSEKVIQRSVRSPKGYFVTSITILAIGMLGVALFVRSRMVTPAREKLELDAGDSPTLNRWRIGTLLSLVLAESVALCGFVLRIMGATLSQASPLYLAAILVMLIWTPRLDLASSGSV